MVVVAMVVMITGWRHDGQGGSVEGAPAGERLTTWIVAGGEPKVAPLFNLRHTKGWSNVQCKTCSGR